MYNQWNINTCAFVQQGSLDINGLQDILSRVFGPRSVLSDRSVLQDIKDIAQEMLRPIRQPDLGLVEEKVDSIIRKVGQFNHALMQQLCVQIVLNA